MASCEPCPPAPINVTVKMTSSTPAPKRCSRQASRAASRTCSKQRVGAPQECPNYMKPLSRTPSYSARVGGPPQVSITVPSGGCCPGHPRPDCCRVPCPPPCIPKCPLGIFAERTQSVKPNRTYEAPETKFDALSTYREHFFRRCGEPAKSLKPLSTFVASQAPLDGLSTYREAYHCKPIVPKEIFPWAKGGKFEPSGAKMEGISQYRFDYKGCMTPRQPSFKPAKTFVPSDAKLEGVTTYRVNYIPYCPREYDYARPKQSARPTGSFSCAPMEGATTYRMDYYPKCMVRTNSLKPSIKPRFSDAKMQGITTYKNDYIPFHFDKCPPNPCFPAEVYDQEFPNPCMFACSGDVDKKEAGPASEECPQKKECCLDLNPCGLDPCQPYPWNVGNAGEQLQNCCDCINDPPRKEIAEEC